MCENFDYSKITKWTKEQILNKEYHDYSNVRTKNDHRGKPRRVKKIPGGQIIYTYWVWNVCYGEYPPMDLHIHHRDENTLNDDIENLEILTQREHVHIHADGWRSKSFEERFGDKVDDIKKKISEKTKEALSSEEMRNKISKATKKGMIGVTVWNKGKHLPDELKEKLSEAMKGKFDGEDNPFYGKTHTKETLKKISEANTGREAWNKGMNLTEERPEIVEKMIESHADFSEDKNPFYGRKHSKSTKEKLREHFIKHKVGETWQTKSGEWRVKTKSGKNKPLSKKDIKK
jgi:hypothetical protein